MIAINELQKLQDNACDAQILATDLCRQALVCATKANDLVFKKWLTQELYGYATIEGLPEYRTTVGILKGYTGFKWIPVNITNPDDEIIKVVYFTQAIPELEALIIEKVPQGRMVFQLNDHLVRQLSKSTGFEANFQVHFNQSECARILQNVKTKILEWSLEQRYVDNEIIKSETTNNMLKLKETHKMQEKKYQIFISSTYLDLIEERQKVIDIILSSEHIPIGMEMFNASNSAQWEVIKRTIDSSDYYVLIVAHKYGSIEESSGISYTEKEYDYAKSTGIPVLCFLVDDTIELQHSKYESDNEKKDKLNEFKNKIRKNLVKYWKTSDALASLVNVALTSAYKTDPRPGWIRNTAQTITNSLAEITAAQKKTSADKIIGAIDELRATNLKPVTPRQIQQLTNLTDEEIFKEMEFLRGRGIIREMGMGSDMDSRMFYR